MLSFFSNSNNADSRWKDMQNILVILRDRKEINSSTISDIKDSLSSTNLNYINDIAFILDCERYLGSTVREIKDNIAVKIEVWDAVVAALRSAKVINNPPSRVSLSDLDFQRNHQARIVALCNEYESAKNEKKDSYRKPVYK